MECFQGVLFISTNITLLSHLTFALSSKVLDNITDMHNLSTLLLHIPTTLESLIQDNVSKYSVMVNGCFMNKICYVELFNYKKLVHIDKTISLVWYHIQTGYIVHLTLKADSPSLSAEAKNVWLFTSFLLHTFME